MSIILAVILPTLLSIPASAQTIPYCDEVKTTATDMLTFCTPRVEPSWFLSISPDGQVKVNRGPTAPKCDDGYEPVLSQAMRPMCARDLVAPK